MLGYIISDKDKINVIEHEIKSFDILISLGLKKLNIFIIEHNKISYKNKIVENASLYGNVKVLEWYLKSGFVEEFYGYKFYIYCACLNGHCNVLKWFKNNFTLSYGKFLINGILKLNILKYLCENINVKKIIKWSGHKYKKTVKFKTKNNYIKGYNKN